MWVDVYQQDALVSEVLLPHKYEAVLFGWDPGPDPDPFPAWHSSQTGEAGRNLSGYVSDRVTWLKYMVEQCEALVAAGYPFEGFTWFPFIDSTDWDGLLGAPRGHIDPVGIYWLEEGGLARRASELSRLYGGLARGELRGADLPAYRLLTPVSGHLAGFRPQWTVR